MKPALTKIFVTLGVIFLLVILIGFYFYTTDPMNLKPLIFGSDSMKSQNDDSNAKAGGFQLSEGQKQALIAAGIDPTKVPTSVNGTQEACFVSALGDNRVGEIKAGAIPSTVEFLKAKSCI